MATIPNACPPPETLEAFALAAAPPADVAAHVAGCAHCAARLERIRADNRLLSDFLSVGPGPATPSADWTPRITGYDILCETQRGGQGVVYRGVQRSTKRDVAIKLMKHGALATISDRQRFAREIEILARLQHPNIVAVHDAGVVDGCQFFVMDYVDGPPLDDAVAALRDATGSPAHERLANILRLFLKVCDAVHAAHLRGVMHCDLKPSNVRVDSAGEPRVLDFGLAKSIDLTVGLSVTETGQFVGSLPWASPEQVAGDRARLDLRTDVYSLGAVLYQLLTGDVAFERSSDLRKAIDRVMVEDPVPPSQRATETLPVDEELETIVLKCLAKDPDRRYQGVNDLARDIRRYLADEPIEAKRDSAIYVLRKTLLRYRRRVAFVAAAGLMLAVLAVSLAVMYRRAAQLEAKATSAAESLASSLSASNVERGRIAAMLGNMRQAEDLLWRELMVQPSADAQHPVRLHPPPGPRGTYWALWELYRRYPLLRTLTPTPECDRVAVVSDDGQSLWTTDIRGGVQRLTPDGVVLEQFRVGGASPLFVPSANGETHITRSESGLRFFRRNRLDAPTLEVATLPSSEAPCLSPSGALVADRDGRDALVWRIDPPAGPLRFQADEAIGTSAISHDDRRIAARDTTGGLWIWDIETGALLAHVDGVGAVRGQVLGELRFSRDGQRLADAWLDRPGRIWNLAASPPTFVELSQPPEPYRIHSFSADGRLLAIGDVGGALRIYDAHTGACLQMIVAQASHVRSVCFTADGRGVWTGGDHKLRLWEVDSDAGRRKLMIDGDRFHGMDILPDRTALFAVGALGQLHRIDADGARRSAPLSAFDPAPARDETPEMLVSIAVSPDGETVAVGSYRGNVRLAPQDLRGPAVALPHPDGVSSIAFSPDGALVATACEDWRVRLWSRDGELLRAWEPHTDRFPQVIFAPDGKRIAALGRDAALIIYDIESGSMTRVSTGIVGAIRAARYTADGKRIFLAGADRTVHVLQGDPPREIARMLGHNQEIYCLDIHEAAALIATGDAGGVVRLWDLNSGEALATFSEHSGPVMALRLDRAGEVLYSASLDGSIRAVDLGHYQPHIATQVAERLAEIDLSGVDPADIAAWRDWAGSVPPAPVPNRMFLRHK